ncbi:MAG: FecR domain-containing protein [Tannerellaceae bacterium]|jgi:ferric-dicitrate binding protein FerR (iron transport regulator)|nr:FecR domain-containing protein [Tannerellaceae bacterium]
MEDNTKYNLVDLLEDDAFIASVNHPDLANSTRWKSLREAGQVTADDYRLASWCVRALHSPSAKMSGDEHGNIWANIQADISRRRDRRKMRILLWIPAAVIGLLLSVGLIVSLERYGPDAGNADALSIEDVALPATVGDDIEIIFSSNNKVRLKDKSAHIQYDGKGVAEVNSVQMASGAESSLADDKPDAFNQVIVPKGKYTSMVFSDGSRLWLNAASRVVYPPVFGSRERSIYLEGEAYLEIEPDRMRPFIVKTKQLEVRALGTAFDVSAYDDEAAQTVVLLSGRVAVRTKGSKPHETELSPNHMFSLVGEDKGVCRVKAEDYISWKDGTYIYKDEKLSVILERLERYYGLTICYEPEVGAMRFTGKLHLKSDPLEVLQGFSNAAPIQCREEDGIFSLYINH